MAYCCAFTSVYTDLFRNALEYNIDSGRYRTTKWQQSYFDEHSSGVEQRTQPVQPVGTVSVFHGYHVDGQLRPVDGLQYVRLGSFYVQRQVVDVPHTERGSDGIQRETLNVDDRCISVEVVDVARYASVQSRQLELGRLRPCRRAQTCTDDVRVAVLVQQRSQEIRIRLDQHAGPVTAKLEEQRVGQLFPDGGSALHEDSIATAFQQVVDQLRAAELREMLAPRSVIKGKN